MLSVYRLAGALFACSNVYFSEHIFLVKSEQYNVLNNQLRDQGDGGGSNG